MYSKTVAAFLVVVVVVACSFSSLAFLKLVSFTDKVSETFALMSFDYWFAMDSALFWWHISSSKQILWMRVFKSTSFRFFQVSLTKMLHEGGEQLRITGTKRRSHHQTLFQLDSQVVVLLKLELDRFGVSIFEIVALSSQPVAIPDFFLLVLLSQLIIDLLSRRFLSELLGIDLGCGGDDVPTSHKTVHH